MVRKEQPWPTKWVFGNGIIDFIKTQQNKGSKIFEFVVFIL